MLLAWARDAAGEKVDAKRLDPRDRRRRAPFTCLGCGEPLVPHLGTVRARHFAHQPGSSCPLTAPETILHLDAKERLLALCADAFAGRLEVTLATRCPGCRRLAPRDLAALGDAAVPEGAIGAPAPAEGARLQYRADVLVTRGGRPALALEVRVTHEVGPLKEDALAAAGVPVVEIDAREDWEEVRTGGATVLPVRSAGFPPCDACRALARADVDRAEGGEAAELAELEAYRARGLFGPAVVRHGPPPASGGGAGPEGPLTEAERAGLEGRFRCPDCGGRVIRAGERLVRHRCAGGPDRPVAWRAYGGGLVELGWWQKG
ncbi:MAG: competence protein CoiA family protein [Anaeromyxobacteraceae bacterium]